MGENGRHGSSEGSPISEKTLVGRMLENIDSMAFALSSFRCISSCCERGLPLFEMLLTFEEIDQSRRCRRCGDVVWDSGAEAPPNE